MIQAAFDSGDSNWQVSALFAMGRSYNEEWAPTVLSMLADDRVAVRAEAAEAAGELEMTDAREPLLEMLADPDENVRAAAIWSLSQIGGDEVGERLKALLEETEDEDEADLIEQALENLEFSEEFNFEFLDLESSKDQDEFDEDDLLPGISDNGRRN
jgi:HEAT repeat protein